MNIEIYQVPSGRKYWVVRAGEGAKYYPHFIHGRSIALGHADDILFDKFTEGKLSSDTKEKICAEHRNSLLRADESKNQIGNKSAQLRRFLFEIEKGDVVITVDDNIINAGIVKSDCYFTNKPIENNINDGKNVKTSNCEFGLRYDVDWGKSQKRVSIPYVLERSLRNTGAVFGVNKVEDVKVLNHWLFPIHFVDNEIRCSVNISSKQSLRNEEITNLSLAYRQLELLASFLETCESDEGATWKKFESFVEVNGDDFNFELTVQHAFMSPGVEFLQLKSLYFEKLIDSKQLYFAVAFASLFNANVSLADDSKNEEQKVSSAQIAILVGNVKTQTKFDKSVEQLKLSIKKPDEALLQKKQDEDFGDAKASDKIIL